MRKLALAKDLMRHSQPGGELGPIVERALDLLIESLMQRRFGKTIGRIYTYVSLKADEDVRIASYQEKQAQAIDLYTAFGEAAAWFAPEILTVGKSKIQGFVAANPALKTRFDFYLANIVRQAEHTLSPEGEAILAIAGAPLQAPGEIAGQLRSSDIPWPTIKLSDGKEVRLDSQGYTLNRDAPNRADRKAVFAWADEVVRDHGKVNLIFNNAGVAHGSTIEATTYEDFEWIMGINFWGVIYGTKAFLPYLKASGEGHIINTSSLFGLCAQPGMGAYNLIARRIGFSSGIWAGSII